MSAPTPRPMDIDSNKRKVTETETVDQLLQKDEEEDYDPQQVGGSAALLLDNLSSPQPHELVASRPDTTKCKPNCTKHQGCAMMQIFSLKLVNHWHSGNLDRNSRIFREQFTPAERLFSALRKEANLWIAAGAKALASIVSSSVRESTSDLWPQLLEGDRVVFFAHLVQITMM